MFMVKKKERTTCAPLKSVSKTCSQKKSRSQLSLNQ